MLDLRLACGNHVGTHPGYDPCQHGNDCRTKGGDLCHLRSLPPVSSVTHVDGRAGRFGTNVVEAKAGVMRVKMGDGMGWRERVSWFRRDRHTKAKYRWEFKQTAL